MGVTEDGTSLEEREAQFQRSVVRVIDRGRKVVGTGFIVAGDLIVTCAHVVREALKKKEAQALRIEGGERIELLPREDLSDDQEPIAATVERELFRDKDAEDVAFLRLDPGDRERLWTLLGEARPLGLATSQGLEEASLRGFAFPKAKPSGALMTATVAGSLGGSREGRRLQLSSTNISPGCSGGPLWDEKGRVVGMAASILDPDKTGRHIDTAFMIAAEVLAEVCRELTLDPESGAPPPSWATLLRLDNEARSGVARCLVAPGSSYELTLPRQDVRNELRKAMDVGCDLLVKGDSGVGKSALVMDAIRRDSLRDDQQAIAINLRHLPDTELALLSLLQSPLVELLSWLTAPFRILVIDGAEAAAEGRGGVLSLVLRHAREAQCNVVVVAATESAGVATELLKAGAKQVHEFVVPALSDEEVAVVSAHFPALDRLAQNDRARELLRRPIVVDLLGRAGDPGLPMSESEALAHIWRQLVRNGERLDSGTPDAREKVMLRLAAHAVRNDDVEDLLDRLDGVAIDGLRRSGLLLPAGKLPWQRVPDFKHDLLRSYSIARHLLRDRDVGAALRMIEAPRWLLPSARLACEVLLAAPDEPDHPIAGRFTHLHESFEKLVELGHGERWADVPTEALLATPNSAELLETSWNQLTSKKARGLARAIRILNGRHRRRGLLDPFVAEPLVARLVDETKVGDIKDEVARLINDWLRAHALRATPADQTTRVALRDLILAQCARNRLALDKLKAAEEAALAARTPEEIAADEERTNRLLGISSFPFSRGRRRPEPTGYRSYLWISDAQIEHLALLGPDLSPDGEAILRRIAKHDPDSLDHAVEAIFAGMALAAHDSQLLIDLTAAYYIKDENEEENEAGVSGHFGLEEYGIRGHRLSGGFGAPDSHFTYGPFLSLFRADYRGGVALVNRMLNHASRRRVRILSHLRSRPSIAESESAMTHLLSITGEQRPYVGDGNVWQWYRGSGVGPHPCMSALQALEFVTEEVIRVGIRVGSFPSILLAGAESLAMTALVLGILVRHLESAGDALDPYLVEPLIWDLEFSRVTNEQFGGLVAQEPKLPNPERRRWSLHEVSTVLAFHATGDRARQLKTLGDRLLSRAVQELDGGSSASAQRRTAVVRRWAASLDRNGYEIRAHQDGFLVQPKVDPEVDRVLEETNVELRRENDAVGLIVRHAHVRDKGGRAPEVTDNDLAKDLASARALEHTSQRQPSRTAIEGAVAVAASAIELHLDGRAQVRPDDLRWSAEFLLRVAEAVTENPDDGFNTSYATHDPSRLAGRTLPFLLLPAAGDLRHTLNLGTPEGVQKLVEICRALASKALLEARLEFARGLDVVWAVPCNNSHVGDRCHHDVAFELVRASYLEAVLGPWDPSTQRRAVPTLDPPIVAALASVHARDIFVPHLTPAIRALGSAAAHSTCCSDRAREDLEALIAAHQRAMLAMEHGYDHSQSDSLVTARAALWQAMDGRDAPVQAYITRYLGDSRLLAEGLQALAAAGEESPEAGTQARRLWPIVMDLVLDSAEKDPSVFTSDTWGEFVEAKLVPVGVAARGYITIEVKDPYRWRDLLGWSPQVERWLTAAIGRRMSIDQLVTAILELDVADQINAGLGWLETLVSRSGHRCVNTFTLPSWLRERRSDLKTDEQIARWQRIVDRLVVVGDTRVADLAD